MSYNVSLPWSLEFIEKYEDKWNWLYLSGNPSLPWTQELIIKYKDKWILEFLLGSRPQISWSVELVDKIKDKLDSDLNGWKTLCYHLKNGKTDKNQIIQIIESFNDYFDWSCWYELMFCSDIWPSQIIEKHMTQWNRGELLSNSKFQWSEEDIDKYCDNWYSISANQNLPWTEELIEKYIDKWDWERLSKNESIPWSENLIEKYEDRWSWLNLRKNEKIPWSFKFNNKNSIQRADDSIDFFYGLAEGNYSDLNEKFLNTLGKSICGNYVNDRVLEEVMKKIDYGKRQNKDNL